MSVEELTEYREDARCDYELWHIDSIRKLLGHIAALDIELTVARGHYPADRQVIERLEADLREATQTVDTARTRIAALQAQLAESGGKL